MIQSDDSDSTMPMPPTMTSSTSQLNSKSEGFVQLNAVGEAAVDRAWGFLKGQTHVDDAVVSAVDLSRLRRKIDWHIVPLMFLCYMMQFLDKTILNYAAVMGIKEDLHFKPHGNEFNNAATFLFVALLCFEIPNTFLLQLLPAAKWLGFNVVCWGIATACGAAATNYQTLLITRVFLGVFEATIAPSLMLISSQWYTKSEQAPRFSFWFIGVGVGQIIGGIVSYGFQHVDANTIALAGWRIMFITLGCATVLCGICTFLFVPDTPMQAKWLSNVEKLALLKHVSVNQTGIQSSKICMSEIAEACLDPQIWLFVLSTILTSIPSGVVGTYSATLIRNLHFPPDQAALMNMPSGVVTIFFTLLVGYGIQKQSHRWAWIIACIIPALIGGALMSFLPVTNRAGILAGIYLVNAAIAPMSIIYNWAAANVAGATKRAFACAVISASFSIGNIIGPQTFQARDAPQFRPAKITVLGSQSGCAVTTLCLVVYYVWCNRRRGHRSGLREDSYRSPETWLTVTDKQNPNFRYTY